jgi:hypothetical protein
MNRPPVSRAAILCAILCAPLLGAADFSTYRGFWRLETLGQAAFVEAGRPDALEAPQRAIEMEKQDAEEDRVALEKARSENMPDFRP